MMYTEENKSPQIESLRQDFLDNFGKLTSPEDTFERLLGFMTLRNLYDSALDEITTKLHILDKEFQMIHMHNPIHHTEHRVKEVRSLAKKMNRKSCELTPEAAREHILDIAGVRVICNYIHDIYTIESLLLKQEDIQLIKRKDYIRNPKENGYQSLHLVITIPVFLSKNVEIVPVEIQLRTIGMDMWASLEHKLHYKNSIKDTTQYRDELKACSEDIARVEARMQSMYNDIYLNPS